MRPLAELLFDAVGRGASALAAAADPDLPDLLAESEGRRLALVVRGTDRALEIEVRGGALHVLPPRRIGPEDLGAGPGAAQGPSPAAAAGSWEAGDEDEAPAADRDEGSRGADTAPDAAHGAPPGGDGEAQGDAPASTSRAGAPAPLGADLLLAGSVPDFLRFLRAIRREPPPGDPFAPLEVHGGAEARAGFVQLLRRIDPDYEALLARAVGGVAARAAARTTLGRLYQARKTAARLVDDVSEYLGEETRHVPDPASRARFAGDVRALIDKVAELEERLDRAARRRG